MPQTFRLRLGDGTILMVDYGGLSTWETDPTAAIGTKDPNKWLPLKEFLVQERAAAFRRAREGDSGESPPADTPAVPPRGDGLPLVPPPETPLPRPPHEVASAELPPPAEGPELAEPALPAPIAEEIDLKPLAAESMGPSQVVPPAAPIEDLPVIPFQSLEDEPPTAVPDGWECGASSAAPDAGVMPLADEPGTRPGGSSHRARISDEPPEPDEPVRLPGLVTAALQWATVLGVILSRGLAPINRLEQGLPLFGIDDPSAPLESHSSPAGEISLPSLSLDLDGARSRVSAALRDLSDRTRGGLEAVASRASGLVTRPARSHPSPLDDPEEPAAPAPVRFAPAPPRPRVQQPPPMATELAALRLAPIREPREVGDVYDGAGGGGIGSSARLWTQRVFLTATVLAGGALAGLHWDAWSPAAGNMGWALFNEIDDRIRWLHLARERQELIDQASEQLPHLARETVGLILSTNRTHVLEPPVVFEAAWGAAERGASTLTASEAGELEALRQELVDALPPLDRERLRTFGQAHARGAVFPFDAQRGLLAYARGVRALRPERQHRLQALLGKAIAAGLDS